MLPGRLALPHPRFRGGMPSSPSPFKGEENDGPFFLVPWSALHSVSELLNLYNPRHLSPTPVPDLIGDPVKEGIQSKKGSILLFPSPSFAVVAAASHAAVFPSPHCGRGQGEGAFFVGTGPRACPSMAPAGEAAPQSRTPASPPLLLFPSPSLCSGRISCGPESRCLLHL